ncbi:MAG: hypothetical protein A2X13_14720 [Bacteroidetes bacterium GWC2_33_15]|nr:MAG: hypothetical protein A2X10_06785 [Bacteroidetes bacterium GWA2_33_15]OFX50126.1 MAG: hypothetical protein A2X13_14720 [Bacteroidetes bacterium GWC2_33_15]OFX65279.1 MAG: hypothetical protein A2X15_04295 [Bacteroidetes bacterium GWB2_32_14]OFX70505.1 MAG: hypothetical protein A2X14_04350 [Bacteroidetes bacterium GWD2_33_33]HAN19622.1 hypothetical protein [Bacteroidales bacterium]
MKVSWNKDGDPMFAAGSNSIVSAKEITTASPKSTTVKENKDNEIKIDNYIIAAWFEPGNDFPNNTLMPYLRKSPALRSGIDYKIALHVGQGLYAVKVTDYNQDGSEITEPYFNPALDKFINSRMITKYRADAYQNLFEYAMAFPQIIMNKSGNTFATIKSIDAPWCRFTKKENGVIKKCLISSLWPDVSGKEDYEVVDVIDLEGTEDEILARAKELKNFIYPLNKNTTGNIYYQLPSWDSARECKHLDISIKIGEFLMYMFDNQMSIKYHIKIPYAYWDKKYPKEDYVSNEQKTERKAKIQADLDAVEQNLTTTKNAKKAIITHFELNPQGKPEEKWEIDVIEDKFKSDEYLPQAAASNAEIFTSLNINPAVKGLSLSGGPYSNSGGGSDIREAFLIDNALAFLSRHEVNAPVEMMARHNFKLDDDIKIKDRSIILTTLDSGCGTKKLS